MNPTDGRPFPGRALMGAPKGPEFAQGFRGFQNRLVALDYVPEEFEFVGPRQVVPNRKLCLKLEPR